MKSWSSELELESGRLGVRGQESGVGVGEWWVRGQGSGVRSWSLELELESEVGGGAEVRANGYGVFAEGPRGGAFGRRQQAKLARSEVGGGAKVRSNGYGVFAEAP